LLPLPFETKRGERSGFYKEEEGGDWIGRPSSYLSPEGGEGQAQGEKRKKSSCFPSCRVPLTRSTLKGRGGKKRKKEGRGGGEARGKKEKERKKGGVPGGGDRYLLYFQAPGCASREGKKREGGVKGKRNFTPHEGGEKKRGRGD